MRVDEGKRAAVLRFALALAAGWLLGYLAWSEGRTPLLAILLPCIAFAMPRRALVFAFALGYYLSCVSDVPAYAATFFSNPLPGVASWAALGVVCSSVWTAAWTPGNGIAVLSIRTLAALVILLAPPIGALSPGAPIVGWGYVLEGWAWVGVVASTAATVASVLLVRRAPPKRVFASLSMLAVLLFIASGHQSRETGVAAGDVYAVNTRLGKPPINDAQMLDRYERIGAIIRSVGVNAQKGEVLVFPETTLGTFDATFSYLLQSEIIIPAREAGVVIVMGMEIQNAEGERYNTVTAYYPDGTRSTIAQRQPALVSMWAPWKGPGHYSADWGRNNHLAIAPGVKAAVAVCYEEYLPGLFLLSQWKERTPLVIAMSNSWAANSARLPYIQRTHFEGMARLFGLRMVRAENLTPAPD